MGLNPGYLLKSFLLYFLSFLGASLDGIYNNAGVEIKCPLKLKKFKPDRLPKKQLKGHFCEKINGKMKLKHSHQYYTQVQVQMFVTGLKSTHFVV